MTGTSAAQPYSVGDLLLAYGVELEIAGAAQVGGSFTGDPAADALLREDPNAFLIGVLFTQGIPAERAWSAPFELRKRLGTLDVAYLAEHGAEVAAAVQAAPMLHRFKNTLPRWIVEAARRLRDDYDSSASGLWPAGDHVLDVTARLAQFSGIGRKKSVMAVEILTRHLGVDLAGRDHGCVAYDVQVRRVFLRAGLVDIDSLDEIEAAARAISPESPGTLDLPTWLVGREWCRPRVPRCDQCRLATACPRLVERDVEGVGSSRR